MNPLQQNRSVPEFGEPTNFAEFVNGLIGILNLLIPLIFAIALVVIIWKVIDAWVINAADPGSVKEGKRTALIGIGVLVLMVSIWGILNVLRSSVFGV